MRRSIVITALLTLLALPAVAQNISLSGTVLERKSGDPVEFATVLIEATGQWSVTDAKGQFTIKNIPVAKSTVTVASLGYVDLSRDVSFTKDISGMKFFLEEDNLTLDGAVVTAKENENSATTSRTIDKTALEHVQVMNITDVASLLPGGATTDNNLVNQKQFNIRAGSASEDGNASFGTAVEVDGVRLSNNASYSETKGVSTNSIASANIESVEVITGVPSVEYGDMGSGVVKVNTKKGKTPWMITMSTSPRTKQASFSKGFGLGKTGKGSPIGIINASAEYTRSVGDMMSPYKSYERKQASITYSNTFARGIFGSHPLRLSAGITGNMGGLDDRKDPDAMVGTFTTTWDNAIRANINANWLLSLPWITNIELNASGAFSDKLTRENKLTTYATSGASLHAKELGYYISAPYEEGGENLVVMIPPGEWYNVMALDDRPLSTKVTLKANWATHFGKASNKIKLGADWNYDYNFGVGEYSEDMTTAPTYREYRFCDNPAMHNVAFYLEDNFMLPVGNGHINLIAGLRNDNTYIKGSAYGLTSSLSPRFNAKYTVIDGVGRRNKFLKELAFRASWGVAVKQPSFYILYPTPTYLDIELFRSTTDAQNNLYRGNYVHPKTINYNSNLRWQRNHQAEFGIEANLGGTRVSLAAFYNKTFDAFGLESSYERFDYYYTSEAAVQGISIPVENRVYVIDRVTGVVTAKDKTGATADIVIAGENRKQLISSTYPDNAESPVTRYGLEWVIDFKRIESIGTTIRLDGNFYSYKSLETDMVAYSPTSAPAADGGKFKYVGYYYGGSSISNGSIRSNLRNNITITTHIPKVRMIVSVKLEASLLDFTRAISDRDGKERAYVLKDRSKILDIEPNASIYDGDQYAVVFPDYYASIDNLDEKIPYLEKLKWAKDNDSNLYTDLSNLAVKTNYQYIFKKDYLSPYFSANFSVTKEIGDIASISFYANNFFNNMGQVYSSKTGNYRSVTNFIPSFYYGLTLRLKF